jgi:molybdopterin converting factor small subunit
MSVKIEIPYYLQQYVNNQEIIEVEGKTIRECLDEVARQYPAMKEQLFDSNGEVGVILLLQGEPVMDGALKNRVKDGDVIGLYPIIIGG